MSMFSENLKRFRNAHNFSMDELVNRLNNKFSIRFTKTTYARWESGETSPSIDHASAIANFFNVTLDEMNGNSSLEISKNEHKNIETIAAHIDDDVTEEELETIKNYIKFIKSNRKK